MSEPTTAAYIGHFSHARRVELSRSFSHPIAWLYLDLERAPELFCGRLGRGWWGLRFDPADFLPPGGNPAAKARALLYEATGERAEGPVFLAASLRSFGLCFNPLALYFCHGADGRLAGVVAEVTNTPWGERATYALGRSLAGEGEKRLFVSPYLDLDERYSWRASEPGERLSVEIENRRAGEITFRARLEAQRVELSPALLRSPRFRYLSSPQRTLALIYGHALVLRARGVGWRSHAAKPAGASGG